jgi:hypothetical protein
MFKKTAKFTKKADVFSAGIVFLELLALKPPSLDMYDYMWPKILSVGLPHALNKLLSGCLVENPSQRLLFPALVDLLQLSGGLEIRNLTYEILSDEFVEFIDYLRDDDADFSMLSRSGVLQEFNSSTSGSVMQNSIKSMDSERTGFQGYSGLRVFKVRGESLARLSFLLPSRWIQKEQDSRDIRDYRREKKDPASSRLTLRGSLSVVSDKSIQQTLLLLVKLE